MMSFVSDNYFTLVTVCACVFIVSCLFLAFTIKESQMQHKEKTGEIEYTSLQLAFLYGGVISFYAAIAISTLVNCGDAAKWILRIN